MHSRPWITLEEFPVPILRNGVFPAPWAADGKHGVLEHTQTHVVYLKY